MRGLKKTAAAILAMALAAALAVPAFATQTYSVVINNTTEGHVYEAYQIFSGNVGPANEDGQRALGNVEWGEGVDAAKAEEGLGAAAEVAANLEKNGGAEDFAKTISGYLVEATASTDKVVNGKYTISDLEPGYYLIKDGEGNFTNDSNTAFILEVVGNVNITPKSSKPTISKQVENTADTTDGLAIVADYAINESFDFVLTATIPAEKAMDSYDEYSVIFNEEMSAGITFESIKSVKVNDTTLDAAKDEYVCSANAGQADREWTLTIENIKPYVEKLSDGATIQVIYSAHLNENAIGSSDVIGSNSNSVSLSYSNDPNVEGDGESFGETVEVFSYVFTYKMTNTKVDGSKDNQPLAGAGFRLYADEACTQEVLLMMTEDGRYYPAPANAEKGVEVFSVAESGSFDIYGLDAGTYYLKETTTPAGYNTCDVVEVRLAASLDVVEPNTPVANFAMYVDGGEDPVNEVVVVNDRGVLLPSTGGAGVYGIYAAGLVLLLGAGFVLLKRRGEGSE